MPKVDKNTLLQYDIRLIVAGTRGFDDFDFFSKCVYEHLAHLGCDKTSKVVMITGKASSGADAMIIKLCELNGWSWVEFPADWDNIEVEGAIVKINKRGKKYNALAGHMRNNDMALIATHLLTFFDGFSPGTRNMIALGKKHCLNVFTVVVDFIREVPNGRQSRKS